MEYRSKSQSVSCFLQATLQREGEGLSRFRFESGDVYGTHTLNAHMDEQPLCAIYSNQRVEYALFQ